MNLIIILNFFNIFTTLEDHFSLVISLFFRKNFKLFPFFKTFSTTFQQQMLFVFLNPVRNGVENCFCPEKQFCST